MVAVISRCNASSSTVFAGFLLDVECGEWARQGRSWTGYCEIGCGRGGRGDHDGSRWPSGGFGMEVEWNCFSQRTHSVNNSK